VRPFDTPPPELAPSLAPMLSLVSFKRNEIAWNSEHESTNAFIVLEGECDAGIDGRHEETAGRATFALARMPVAHCRGTCRRTVRSHRILHGVLSAQVPQFQGQPYGGPNRGGCIGDWKGGPDSV
jgi:hypothetical protein